MLSLRSSDTFWCWIVFVSGLLGFGFAAAAENVTVRLATGDQVSGTIISDTTNSLVLSNSWISELTIPRDQIVLRLTNAAPGELQEKVSTLVAQAARANAKESLIQTNGWRGEAQLGLNFLYGAKDQQIFYGRFKLLYVKPYKHNPKKAFRNSTDYSAEYGRTEGVTSSDRMSLSDKTAFDVTDDWYVYNLVSGGYDHIQKINAQYGAGPGVGYHLFTRTNFTMNLETGLNYQAQFRSDDSDVQSVYARFAEELVWKINGRLSLSEKLEISPRVDLQSLRGRSEITLSYELWRNLALNVTCLDSYDSDPADNVARNELQIRSALGLKF